MLHNHKFAGIVFYPLQKTVFYLHVGQEKPGLNLQKTDLFLFFGNFLRKKGIHS